MTEPTFDPCCNCGRDTFIRRGELLCDRPGCRTGQETAATTTTYTFEDTCGRLSAAELDEANNAIAEATTEAEAWAALEAYEAKMTEELEEFDLSYGLLEAVAESAMLVKE